MHLVNCLAPLNETKAMHFHFCYNTMPQQKLLFFLFFRPPKGIENWFEKSHVKSQHATDEMEKTIT